MRRYEQSLDRRDKFQGEALMGKFNKNEKWNKKDVRQAVLIKQREKRGGAKKTGKKRE